MPRRLPVLPLLLGVLLAVRPDAFAQSGVPDPPPADVAVSSGHPVEIDQSLISLPTTLPLHAHKGYFRLTHRFAHDLGLGSVGSLAADVFSLHSGAVLQLNFGNSFGTTPGMVARGGTRHEVFMGFNLSRKF